MKQASESNLKKNIHHRFQSILKAEKDNPVLKARACWSTLSDQLSYILGPEVHAQWFSNAKPLTLSNNILIVQTESVFASQWITNHYQLLAETLLKSQDKDLSCFFISPKNITRKRRSYSK